MEKEWNANREELGRSNLLRKWRVDARGSRPPSGVAVARPGLGAFRWASVSSSQARRRAQARPGLGGSLELG